MDGDVGFDIGADPNQDQFALTGLANSFNITGIYEKYGFSARVAYNWRDKYPGSAQPSGQQRNPVLSNRSARWMLNVSYDVTEDIAVSFEGVNLTGEPIRTYGRDKDQLWFAQELKPRFYLGARYRFGGSPARAMPPTVAPPPPPPPPPATRTCPDGSVILATDACAAASAATAAATAGAGTRLTCFTLAESPARLRLMLLPYRQRHQLYLG